MPVATKLTPLTVSVHVKVLLVIDEPPLLPSVKLAVIEKPLVVRLVRVGAPGTDSVTELAVELKLLPTAFCAVTEQL